VGLRVFLNAEQHTREMTQQARSPRRQECWEMIFNDPELGYILGHGDVAKGHDMLHAMKSVRELDISGDGRVSADELARLCNPVVLLAAEARVRCDAVWTAAEGRLDANGDMDRQECWDMIFSDAELGFILGRGDVSKGGAILRAMEAVRALDVNDDGAISEAEFGRLCAPQVIVAAELRVVVSRLWPTLTASAGNGSGGGSGGGDKGTASMAPRAACWAALEGDLEAAFVLGRGDAVAGKAVLAAIKTASGGASKKGRLNEAQFADLCGPQAVAAAEGKVAASQAEAVAALGGTQAKKKTSKASTKAKDGGGGGGGDGGGPSLTPEEKAERLVAATARAKARAEERASSGEANPKLPRGTRGGGSGPFK